MDYPEGSKEIHRNTIDKARQGKRAYAIRAKCLECSCWSAHEVLHCPIKDCFLHPFRMLYQKEKG